jgi:nucleoid DNA-binding protein
MDELIKLVTQKAGISEDQAKKAVSAVLDFLKQRLPAPIAGQIEGLLSGGSLPDVSKGLGGLFGK